MKRKWALSMRGQPEVGFPSQRFEEVGRREALFEDDAERGRFERGS
jgi:hypothetical protein